MIILSYTSKYHAYLKYAYTKQSTCIYMLILISKKLLKVLNPLSKLKVHQISMFDKHNV
jgi:hypothetical protein